MSDETTSLPCPLCGGNMHDPITKQWKNCLGDISYSAWIKCWNCNLTLETDGCGYETEEAAEKAAIATWNTRATHGTLTAEQVREAAKSGSHKYKSPVDDGIWIKKYDWQAIADELNAKLGSGTCEFEINTDMTAVKCSECGYKLPKGADLATTRFCGGCGKRCVYHG